MVQVSPEAWQQANRKWHKTQNLEIVDLNRFKDFSINKSLEPMYPGHMWFYKVVGRDCENGFWEFITHDQKETCEKYLNELYSILKQ